MTSNYINNSINQIAGAELIKNALNDEAQLMNLGLTKEEAQKLIGAKNNLEGFLNTEEGKKILDKLNVVDPTKIKVDEKSDEKKKYRMAVKYSAQPLFIPPPFRTNFNPLGSAVPQVAMTFKPEYELEEVKDKSDATIKLNYNVSPGLTIAPPGLPGVPLGVGAPGLPLGVPGLPLSPFSQQMKTPFPPVQRGPPSVQNRGTVLTTGLGPLSLRMTGGAEDTIEFPEYLELADSEMEGGDDSTIEFPEYLEIDDQDGGYNNDPEDGEYHSTTSDTVSPYDATVQFPEKVDFIKTEPKKMEEKKFSAKEIADLEELDDKGDNLDDLDEEPEDDEDDEDIAGGAVYLSPVLSPTLTISSKDYELEVPVIYNTAPIEYPNLNNDPDLIKKTTKYFFEKTMNSWLYSDFEDLLMYLIVEKSKVRLVRNGKELDNNKRDTNMKSLDMKIEFIAENVMTKYDMKSFLKKYAMKTGIDLWNLKEYKSYIKKSLYKKLKSKLEKLAFHS